MNNALVVGGTRGFGKAITEELKKNKIAVTTVGRSSGDYVVDIGDKEKWSEILNKLKSEEKFDIVVFVAGFARVIDPSKRTKEDFSEHRQKNVGYVESGLNELSFSENAKVVTIGSQWSYKSDSDELQPYIKAKHELRSLTTKFAKEYPEMSVVHLSVPPMKTPQRELVWSEYGTPPDATEKVELGKIEEIAKVVVDETLSSEFHGETFQISTEGEMIKIRDDNDEIRESIIKRL